ncbi:HPr family phosphocarrier protein [Dethiothermospora halolimnae]|uniref:HPr family phosphocarrier protein n=1 Tax=Dethiothermospora halolimnae TaxID=3114390 RepID=UPI003CCBA71A
MEKKNVIIKNKIGLHARPAALFVQTASKFLSEIYLQMGDKKINAKSIMGIMALGVSEGDEVTIITEGDDEKRAIEELVDLLENKLSEE